MFDIGWSELVVIAVVALIAIGPKELPGVLRTIGHWMGKVRRMASDFQNQFQEAMREAEMDDLKKQVDEFAANATDIGADLNKEFETATQTPTEPAAATGAETPADPAPASADTAPPSPPKASASEPLPHPDAPSQPDAPATNESRPA